ncbi:terminase [Acidobacteria bacterium ACD]|nr:MAG: terminase [Acidobacteriota bacterium]MDL1950885.1 terminase [Acidobacteria bacterium ACD]
MKSSVARRAPVSLAHDLQMRLDPAALMTRAGMPPDPWQRDLLRSNADRMLLMCARQTGKSTVTAAIALHECFYSVGSLVLLLSPSLRQSQEVFRKVTDFRNRLGDAVPVKDESALRVEWTNGSRIVALPGTEETVRGFSGVRLLIVDEAARVADPLYFAIRPMLAVSGGRMVCLTTPFGKRGFFHDEWTGTGPWERIRITARDCPRISKAFLDEERNALGEWWFKQEYLCEFSDTTDQFFRTEDILRAFSDEVEPLFPSRTGGLSRTEEGPDGPSTGDVRSSLWTPEDL